MAQRMLISLARAAEEGSGLPAARLGGSLIGRDVVALEAILASVQVLATKHIGVTE